MSGHQENIEKGDVPRRVRIIQPDQHGIASGTSLVDALNVSSYSSELKAPVLLTERDETAEETLNEISRL